LHELSYPLASPISLSVGGNWGGELSGLTRHIAVNYSKKKKKSGEKEKGNWCEGSTRELRETNKQTNKKTKSRVKKELSFTCTAAATLHKRADVQVAGSTNTSRLCNARRPSLAARYVASLPERTQRAAVFAMLHSVCDESARQDRFLQLHFLAKMAAMCEPS
jgi:hypothetical protein